MERAPIGNPTMEKIWKSAQGRHYNLSLGMLVVATTKNKLQKLLKPYDYEDSTLQKQPIL